MSLLLFQRINKEGIVELGHCHFQALLRELVTLVSLMLLTSHREARWYELLTEEHSNSHKNSILSPVFRFPDLISVFRKCGGQTNVLNKTTGRKSEKSRMQKTIRQKVCFLQ